MAFPTIQNLLEAGVHFGHQTSRWNPKMKRFIFAERNGIHIIDLKKTLFQLKKAYDLVNEIVAQGGTILFVGTKRQLREVIREEAERCGMYYVNERWLGGMMTNFQTIKKNIRRLNELERMKEEGEFELRTKKEGLSLNRELIKLQKILDGIKNLGDIPKIIFVVDALKEKIAVAESNKLGVPLIALMDTNADPGKATVPVAGNDDAIRSVKLITQTIADAVLEGKSRIPEKPVEVEAISQKKRHPERRGEAVGAAGDERKSEQPRRARPRRRPRKKRPMGEGAAPRADEQVRHPQEAGKPKEAKEKKDAGDTRPAEHAGRPKKSGRAKEVREDKTARKTRSSGQQQETAKAESAKKSRQPKETSTEPKRTSKS